MYLKTFYIYYGFSHVQILAKYKVPFFRNESEPHIIVVHRITQSTAEQLEELLQSEDIWYSTSKIKFNKQG